ncbi:gamma-glutamyltransferase [Polynucleobacter sp. IMCC 30228]|uniref:gamma-glutamyltransferase n=1 Tax=Polynucleobacter sp. IMCC 30228 TaxID=2781011 RepID=UPI001F23EAB3|nr:gamma-glutamyltransferase [Polynucleobacter sp. IMCC 30228]MCE7527297.1 gamma-glutamyltransferase [Polynucleobacter sp. IMCC 30228]
MRGAVVCSHQIAADAGAKTMEHGGNAIDATVAVAMALAVLDPANCGIGGYGGFMVIQKTPHEIPITIDFNATVANEFNPALLTSNKIGVNYFGSAASVSTPLVLSGLLKAHQEFGSQDFAPLLNTAIAAAQEGFIVGQNLQMALSWAAARADQFPDNFKAIFAPDGKWLQVGDRLIQAELANTLTHIQADPVGFFYQGEFAAATSQFLLEHGGWLSKENFNQQQAKLDVGNPVAFHGSTIYGPNPLTSGFGIVQDALQQLSNIGLQELQAEKNYIALVADALRIGWRNKREAFAVTKAAEQHTTHFCISDTKGMTVSCTFTQGPLWFGSGLITPGTGVVLNCAGNLFRQSRASGKWLCVTNLSPNVMLKKNGDQIASGSPGGPRIPAIILQIILEMSSKTGNLQQAINRLRVSVTPNGELELEDEVLAKRYQGLKIHAAEYFGPTSALLRAPNGDLHIGTDDRFEKGVAWV